MFRHWPTIILTCEASWYFSALCSFHCVVQEVSSRVNVKWIVRLGFAFTLLAYWLACQYHCRENLYSLQMLSQHPFVWACMSTHACEPLKVFYLLRYNVHCSFTANNLLHSYGPLIETRIKDRDWLMVLDLRPGWLLIFKGGIINFCL